MKTSTAIAIALGGAAVIGGAGYLVTRPRAYAQASTGRVGALADRLEVTLGRTDPDLGVPKGKDNTWLANNTFDACGLSVDASVEDREALKRAIEAGVEIDLSKCAGDVVGAFLNCVFGDGKKCTGTIQPYSSDPEVNARKIESNREYHRQDEVRKPIADKLVGREKTCTDVLSARGKSLLRGGRRLIADIYKAGVTKYNWQSADVDWWLEHQRHKELSPACVWEINRQLMGTGRLTPTDEPPYIYLRKAF